MNIREKIKKAIAEISDEGRSILEDVNNANSFPRAMAALNGVHAFLVNLLEKIDEMEPDSQWESETCNTCDFRKGYACKYGPPGHNGKPTRMTLPPQIGTPPQFRDACSKWERREVGT